MADLQSGESFANGQSFDGARANNAINGATILPGFITGKSADVPITVDTIVFYQDSSSSLKKTTLSNLLTLIGTNNTFTGNTNISEAFMLGGDISPAQITATTNDYAPTGFATASVLRLTTDANRVITGIAGGTDGRTIFIHNVGSFPITLNSEAASSLAVNRISLVGGAALLISPNQLIILQYDSTSSRWRTPESQLNPKESLIVAVGDETTAITTGTAKVTFRMPYGFTISDIRASLSTASSSGIPTVDIKEAGTTILSTLLTIDATELTSTTAAAPVVVSDTSLADDAQMTIDITVAGTGAKGLKVTLIGRRT